MVFTALGNVSLAVLCYRTGEQSLPRALLTNLKWIPLMSIFLGGISPVRTVDLLAYLLLALLLDFQVLRMHLWLLPKMSNEEQSKISGFHESLHKSE